MQAALGGTVTYIASVKLVLNYVYFLSVSIYIYIYINRCINMYIYVVLVSLDFLWLLLLKNLPFCCKHKFEMAKIKTDK